MIGQGAYGKVFTAFEKSGKFIVVKKICLVEDYSSEKFYE